jgi:hypothetical protein
MLSQLHEVTLDQSTYVVGLKLCQSVSEGSHHALLVVSRHVGRHVLPDNIGLVAMMHSSQHCFSVACEYVD